MPLAARNERLTVLPGPLPEDELRARIAGAESVVIMKVGHSEIGAKAASSHTASLAGEDGGVPLLVRHCRMKSFCHWPRRPIRPHISR